MTKRRAQAECFYRVRLHELIQKYSVQGVIAYDTQAQVVEAIMNSARKNNCFIIADVFELFRVSFRYLTNGISYQQFLSASPSVAQT